MAMTKRWRIECDAKGCEAAEVSAQRSKTDAGMEFNDLGWQAGPGSPRTYCDEHWLSGEDWRGLLPAPLLPDPFGQI